MGGGPSEEGRLERKGENKWNCQAYPSAAKDPAPSPSLRRPPPRPTQAPCQSPRLPSPQCNGDCNFSASLNGLVLFIDSSIGVYRQVGYCSRHVPLLSAPHALKWQEQLEGDGTGGRSGWCEVRLPYSQMEARARAAEGGPGKATSLCLEPSAVQGLAWVPSWAHLLGSCN